MASLSILGGGPAGLACGIRLLEAGWSVTLHERGRYPLKKVCGEFVSPAAWSRLQALGAGPFLPDAPPLRRARFYQDATRCVDFDLEPAARGLSRAALDAALADRFRQLGGDLQEGSAWDGPAQPGQVDARGRPALPGPGRYFAWKGYLAEPEPTDGPERADLTMLPLSRGYAGISRVEDGRISVCLIARAPASLDALLGSHPVLAALAPRLRPHAAVAGFELGGHPGTGRLGDRARVWPPVVGDGIGQALAAGEDEAEARSQGRRRPRWRGAMAFRAAQGLHAVMMHPQGRRLAGALLRRWPAAATVLYRSTRA